MKPLLAALLLALAAPAAAQALRPADIDRLESFDAAFGRALAQALASGTPSDVDLLVEALSGPAGEVAPAGEWSCRTLKLGGLAPLIAYPPFRCRITSVAPGTWRIEKLTGSQRLVGTITAADGVHVYTGVGFVGEAPAMPYEALPPDDQTPVEPGQTYAQVGLFEQAGPNRARLLLPRPILESEFDILWLTR